MWRHHQYEGGARGAQEVEAGAVVKEMGHWGVGVVLEGSTMRLQQFWLWYRSFTG